MMRSILIFVILMFFFSCKKNNNTIDLRYLELDVPKSWIFSNNSVDSFSRQFFTQDDTIFISIGMDVYPNFLEDEVIVYDSMIYRQLVADGFQKLFEGRNIIISPQGVKTLPCILNNTYSYIDTINNKEVAIFKPKNFDGFMGLYCIDKNKPRINIWVKNPSEKTKEDLSKAFKTIKWK